jgi:hypothetical protein
VNDDETKLADWFWRQAGGPTPFPRDIGVTAAWILPLFFVELPGLTVAAVGSWLRQRGIFVPDLPTRPLRACLVARSGGGVVILDANDPADERRYSAAHEVSHFLRDHLAVREQACRAMGTAVLDVIDGLRQPTADERIAALFADLRLRPLTHLLDRDRSGNCLSGTATEAEAAADWLALELLAPRAEAERRLAPLRGGINGSTWDTAADRLVRDFGLPVQVARRYASHLFCHREARRPLREWLGLAGRTANSENRCRTSCVPPEYSLDGD